MDFTLGLKPPFNLDYTLESGQVFRWVRRGEWWLGVLPGGVVRVKQEGDTLRCVTSSERLDSQVLQDYFRLGEDLDAILASIARDQTISRAIEKFYGLRLMVQDRWECLASFVLATNANIPRIKKMVHAVCEMFGDEIQFEGGSYRSFPKPSVLSEVSIEDLRECGLGYRAPFLKKIAKSVEDGGGDLTSLGNLGYDEGRSFLRRTILGEKVLLGVGPKVADCVLLYSCGKDEAFPIDIWISRVLARSYPEIVPRKLSRKLSGDVKFKLGLGDYETISKVARAYFGPYSGFAQQYLYMSARSGL